MSIKDRVQSGTGDEGWSIHTDGSLRYRGRVVDLCHGRVIRNQQNLFPMFLLLP